MMRMAGIMNNKLEFQLTVCHTSGKPKGLPRILFPLCFGKLLSIILKSM
jgi:hypothetical protein